MPDDNRILSARTSVQPSKVQPTSFTPPIRYRVQAFALTFKVSDGKLALYLIAKTKLRSTRREEEEIKKSIDVARQT